jgi:Protein of unknown function (DUF3618)
MRSELGDTVEEVAHRVHVPAQVRAKKDDTIARLQAPKDQAARRVQESAETVRALLADKVGQARTPTARRPRPDGDACGTAALRAAAVVARGRAGWPEPQRGRPGLPGVRWVPGVTRSGRRVPGNSPAVRTCHSARPDRRWDGGGTGCAGR